MGNSTSKLRGIGKFGSFGRKKGIVVNQMGNRQRSQWITIVNQMGNSTSKLGGIGKFGRKKDILVNQMGKRQKK